MQVFMRENGSLLPPQHSSSTDDETAELLKEFDFYILPSANPDGYEHSRLFDRFWRKTRSRNSNSILGLFCIGVDPNRYLLTYSDLIVKSCILSNFSKKLWFPMEDGREQ
ncbi:hypothetical protein SSS_08419 [Sarcoptes scabiei]|nr:hypothetical protein SSS_08419 [Sarcoptes scabiei]